MVNLTLQRTIDSLSMEDRASLLEYLERTSNFNDTTLTEAQLAVIASRDAEMDANPSIGVSEDEFMSKLRNKWA